MMLPPARPHPDGYFDGQIYSARDRERRGEWEPTFEFEAPAGSAIVVYPGMIHETLSTGEECSSSILQTFDVPLAAAYYRAFWPRFSLIHEDVGACGSLVESMVTFDSGTPKRAAAEAEARKAAAAFAAKIDSDGDGFISESEIEAARKAKGRTLDELISFHDVDDDGAVTVGEVESSWVMYATASRRARQPREVRGEL